MEDRVFRVDFEGRGRIKRRSHQFHHLLRDISFPVADPRGTAGWRNRRRQKPARQTKIRSRETSLFPRQMLQRTSHAVSWMMRKMLAVNELKDQGTENGLTYSRTRLDLTYWGRVLSELRWWIEPSGKVIFERHDRQMWWQLKKFKDKETSKQRLTHLV